MKVKIITTISLVLLILNSSAQQLDNSLIPYRNGNKWGFSTTGKTIVITPRFDEVDWFSEGLAAVKINNKYGYINTQGKLVIPAKFRSAGRFRKGYLPDEKKQGGDSILFAGASIATDGFEICINSKGNRMLKCPAINENTAKENSSPIESVVKQKNYTIPNNDGLFDKIIDDYSIPGNDETYYIAMKGNNYGVFDSKFRAIIPFEYNRIELNRNGEKFLLVNKAGLWGIIGLDGKVTIAPEYTNLQVVKTAEGKEYVIVQKEGKTFVKDIYNNDVIATGYTRIDYDKDGGFIISNDSNAKGFYFTDNSVIQPKYKEIKLLAGGKFLKVKTINGKDGFVSKSGEEYFTE